MTLTTSRTLRIGTRGSRLALWQAHFIESLVRAEFPALSIQVSVIHTTGDKNLESPLSEIGGKGVFVKEIEEALLSASIDIAVHSMKDLPAALPLGLAIGAVAQRRDARDALVSRGGVKFADLASGAKIATGSARRRAQALAIRRDVEILPIRGNVDTRLRKLHTTEGFDALILASAGLERMGFGAQITEFFPVETFIPAPCQGIVAIEQREDDGDVSQILSRINHEPSWICASAERAFLEALGGGCQVPAGCHASILQGGRMRIIGAVASPDGATSVRREAEGDATDARSLGRELAESVLAGGGAQILATL
ncbi:MAG: hydroxymethylbilane synthase [Deltaproteobacteria bacterium]